MTDQATIPREEGGGPGMVPGYRQPVLRILILAPVGAGCFVVGIPIELIVFGLLLAAYKGPQWTTNLRTKLRSRRTSSSDRTSPEGASDSADSDELDALRANQSGEAAKRKSGVGAWRSKTSDEKKATGKPSDDSKSWRSTKSEEKLPALASSPLSALKKAKGPQLQWRSIINKFTPEKFDKLTEQLLDTIPKKPGEGDEPADPPVNYQQVIADMLSLVFEAASRQHQYTEMYTELCRKLLDYVVEQEPDFDRQHSVWEKCQSLFTDMVLKPVQIPDDLPEDEYMDRKMKHKHMMVGTVKFGGDLVSHGLVPCDGVMRWIHALLSEKQFLQEDLIAKEQKEAKEQKASNEDDDIDDDPRDRDDYRADHAKEKDCEQRETQLEVLCAILASMGPSLSDSNTWSDENRSMMEDVFSQLEAMSMDSSSLSLRIRCLIRDILDLRIANWKEKEGIMKPQRLESRDKKEEEEPEDDRDRGGGLRSSAPEFVPGSRSSFVASTMDQGKQWLDPQLLGSLTAVEHHVEVIEDKDTKVARLKSLVQLYHLINGQQIVIVANSSNIRRVIELFEESFKDVPHSALDFNTSEALRKKNIAGFEKGEIAILIMASEVSTRRDFEIGKAAAVLVNFDFPVTLQLYLYRIYKRADGSTHVYTFFSPQFDIRHTSPLLAAMELAKQKVPPALQKLRDHAPRPEYQREGGKGKGDHKGRDMESGSSVSASSKGSRPSPKAGERDGKQSLDEDGDRTPKPEPPWKKSEAPERPERRGDATPGGSDRRRDGDKGVGKGDGKGKGSRPMNPGERMWRGERDSDWREEGRLREELAAARDEGPSTSTAQVIKPRIDRFSSDGQNEVPEELELRRARTNPLDESQLRRREIARRPEGSPTHADGQLRRRENARRGENDGDHFEGNSHADGGSWKSADGHRRRNPMGDDKPAFTPSGGKGDRRVGDDRGPSEGFRPRRDGDPTSYRSSPGHGKSGDDVGGSSKGSRFHSDNTTGKGERRGDLDSRTDRPRAKPGDLSNREGKGGPVRRSEGREEGGGRSPPSNEKGGRHFDDGSWNSNDRFSGKNDDNADRSNVSTPSNRGSNNYRHNNQRSRNGDG